MMHDLRISENGYWMICGIVITKILMNLLGIFVLSFCSGIFVTFILV